MYRKWTLESKQKLISDAEKFDGTRSEYLKKVGIPQSQYYRYLKDVNSSKNTAKPQVFQLTAASASSGVELYFPSGHRLRFTGIDAASVAACVFQQLEMRR